MYWVGCILHQIIMTVKTDIGIHMQWGHDTDLLTLADNVRTEMRRLGE